MVSQEPEVLLRDSGHPVAHQVRGVPLCKTCPGGLMVTLSPSGEEIVSSTPARCTFFLRYV